MSAPENKPEGTAPSLEAGSPAEETMTQAPLIEGSEEMDPAAMQAAYDASFKNMAEGAVVTGTILKVAKAHVIIDVGFKSEGLIPLEEFCDEEGKIAAEVGDKLDVLLE